MSMLGPNRTISTSNVEVERERKIESTSSWYAAYLAVIRVIPRLSGELLESNRVCDRWCATGWRGDDEGRERVRREDVPLPSRFSCSSRGASNKRGRQVDDPPRTVRRTSGVDRRRKGSRGEGWVRGIDDERPGERERQKIGRRAAWPKKSCKSQGTLWDGGFLAPP